MLWAHILALTIMEWSPLMVLETGSLLEMVEMVMIGYLYTRNLEGFGVNWQPTNLAVALYIILQVYLEPPLTLTKKEISLGWALKIRLDSMNIPLALGAKKEIPGTIMISLVLL